MKYQLYLLGAICFFVLNFSGCISGPQEKVSTANTILIYGRDTCMNCQALKNSLDRAGVPYQFFNVDNDRARNSEMWEKIRNAQKGATSITFPVVEVNGTVLLNHPANIDMLRQYLK